MEVIFLFAFFFTIGLFTGSFLNVLALRHNTGKNIMGRSSCFSCGEVLHWYKLIPVISFFLQRGRCKNCGTKISWQYPIVELVTGIMFLSVFWKVAGGDYVLLGQVAFLEFLFFIVIFSLLIVISVYDIHHKIIPETFVYFFIIISFLYILIDVVLRNVDINVLINHVFAGFIYFGLFAGIWFISSGRAMGFGDAKLSAGIGLLLGLGNGAIAVVFSFWTGALVGVFLLLTKHRHVTMKSEIPFGPFLAIGSFLAFLFDETSPLLEFSNFLF